MNKDELIKRIFYIDYREAWVEKEKVLALSSEEKNSAENILLEMLAGDEFGWLACEALSLLRSRRALPSMYSILTGEKADNIVKIMVASSIYSINRDKDLIPLAISLMKALDNKFSLIRSFYYLKKMNCEETLKVIKEYENDPEYLVSYNAKRCLG